MNAMATKAATKTPEQMLADDDLIPQHLFAEIKGMHVRTIKNYRNRGLHNVRLGSESINGTLIGVRESAWKRFWKLVDKRRGLAS